MRRCLLQLLFLSWPPVCLFLPPPLLKKERFRIFPAQSFLSSFSLFRCLFLTTYKIPPPDLFRSAVSTPLFRLLFPSSAPLSPLFRKFLGIDSELFVSRLKIRRRHKRHRSNFLLTSRSFFRKSHNSLRPGPGHGHAAKHGGAVKGNIPLRHFLTYFSAGKTVVIIGSRRSKHCLRRYGVIKLFLNQT